MTTWVRTFYPNRKFKVDRHMSEKELFDLHATCQALRATYENGKRVILRRYMYHGLTVKQGLDIDREVMKPIENERIPRISTLPRLGQEQVVSYVSTTMHEGGIVIHTQTH